MNTQNSLTYRQEFVKTTAAAGTPEKLTARSIVSMTRAGTGRKVTVVSTGHGYTPGAVVYVSGANEAEFNTATIADNFSILGARVSSVIDADTYTLNLAGTTAAATGTLVAYADIWVRQATILGKLDARTPNTGLVYIGTKSANDAQAYEIVPNGEAFLGAGREGVGPIVNLADFYLDVITNGDGIYAIYY